MATEKILIFDEQGNAKRMKVRIARFLDNEPVTASDKTNIRTTLDVDDSLSGTFTTPLSVTSASDSSFTGGGDLNVSGGKTTLTNDSDNALVVETTNKNPMYVNVVGAAPNYLFDVRDDDTSKFRVDGSGRVGIGGSPTRKLELQKTGFLGSSTLGSPTDSTVSIDVRGNSSTDIIQGEVLGAYTLDAYDSSTATGGGVTQNSGMHFVAGNHFGPSASSVDLVFATGANGSTAERWRINSSGNLVANSTGIDFGSTTTGTGTVTGGLLDDYETGTWEPYLSFGGGGTGITYGERLGYYTKIGDRVFVSGVITLTAVGSSTGTATVQGLPFTASNASSTSRDNLTFSYANGMTGLGGTVVAIIIPNQTYANLFQWAASGTSLINNTEFTNSTTIRFNGQYHV